MHKRLLAGTVVLLSACSPGTQPQSTPVPDASATAQAPLQATPVPAPEPAPRRDTSIPSNDASPTFVDSVWRINSGQGGEVGSTYTFLRGGVLVIQSPHGTQMTGKWYFADGKLAMTEDGATYPTDILSQDADHLVLRSHNPGGSVDIALVLVPGAPLPTAP